MPKYLTQQDAYRKCEREGRFIALEDVDITLIQATRIIAEGDAEAAESLKKNLPKDSRQWNGVLKLSYDAIHELAEALLRFDKVKIDNHQCLFAYLCEKHPELGLNWEFLETFRTKRNGINYYGCSIHQSDWKALEVQFMLTLHALREEVKKRLKGSDAKP